MPYGKASGAPPLGAWSRIFSVGREDMPAGLLESRRVIQADYGSVIEYARYYRHIGTQFELHTSVSSKH